MNVIVIHGFNGAESDKPMVILRNGNVFFNFILKRLKINLLVCISKKIFESVFKRNYYVTIKKISRFLI